MSIRPASSADTDHIAALEKAAAFHPWSASSIASALASPVSVAFVHPDAYVLATAVVDEGEILTVGVHPRARRRGLGRQMMEAVASEWGNRGVTQGFLEVRHDNTAARALYAALSWEEIGMRKDYYGSGAHAVLLRWSP